MRRFGRDGGGAAGVGVARDGRFSDPVDDELAAVEFVVADVADVEETFAALSFKGCDVFPINVFRLTDAKRAELAALAVERVEIAAVARIVVRPVNIFVAARFDDAAAFADFV